MAAVQAFYLALLEDLLGHAIPIPQEVSHAEGAETEALERWLSLLDLAITPLMLRDALKESTTPESAEALLRYFVSKNIHADADRDKTDFIVTFLYRVKVPEEMRAGGAMDVEVPSEFEEEIYALLGREEVVPLPEEHRQLVREFPFIRDEVEDFRHFDELMDSGIVQRVRELKQRFGASFYHPRVLATIAGYNVFFGRQFDELFRRTAQHIKQFASAVQQQGGSISSRVDGDVTVKHLAEVKEGEILRTEYGRAQEHFRRISKFKKAVDSRTGAQSRHAAAAAVGGVPQAVLAASVPAMAAEHLLSGVDPVVEHAKLQTMEDSIRNFILAADPRSANIVPLRNANVSLSGPEVDAFRAHYGAEKSFRADLARVLRQAISLQARFISEIQDYAAKQSSAYLWKPHADALTWLLSTAQRVQDDCTDLLHTAEHRGLSDKVTAINGALQRVRTQVQAAVKALQGNGSGGCEIVNL
jgi:hypothetical protein